MASCLIVLYATVVAVTDWMQAIYILSFSIAFWVILPQTPAAACFEVSRLLGLVTVANKTLPSFNIELNRPALHCSLLFVFGCPNYHGLSTNT